MRFGETLFVLMACAFIGRCSSPSIEEKAPVEHVQKQLAKFEPVVLTHDLSHLPVQEMQVVKLLVKASREIDEIFLDQVFSLNGKIRNELARSKNPDDRHYLDYFNIMFGPWDRLDGNAPFINSLPKPAGANFYPPDLTRAEYESWLKSRPEDKEAFESNFSVIRRKGKSLTAVPYSDYYTDALIRIADDLRQAALLTSDPSLKKYLSSRADALLADNYF
ncbi:peptidase, partial [bacterium]|nr:peptidase [bacterium]